MKSLKPNALTTNDFPQKFKFEYDRWLFVKAKLNNKPKEIGLLLDTGSPCTYDFKAKDTFNLKSKRFLHLGEYKADYGNCALSIAGLNYTDKLACMFMNNPIYNRPNNYGIVGVNAMQNTIWQLNFDDSTVTVSDTLNDFKFISDAYRVKFEPYSAQQTPVVKLVLNHNDTVKAFLDSGNFGLLDFNSKLDIDKIEQQHPGSLKTSYYNTNQGAVKKHKGSLVNVNRVRLQSLGLGNYELNSVIVESNGLYKGKNLLGLQFLKNFIVTIDWIHYYIYLKPIKIQSFGKNFYTYGFEFYRFHGIEEVTDIYKGSKVEQAGIKCGDEIVKINNIDTKDIGKDLRALINESSPSDKEITVLFKNRKELVLKKEALFKN